MIFDPSRTERTSPIRQPGARIASPAAAMRPRCPGCFAEKDETNCCPDCRYDAQAARDDFLLPPLTLLANNYEVGRVLGSGAFGITYLGWDRSLATRVAIKEYLPRDYAQRAPDRVSVKPHSNTRKAFEDGLERFQREARTLARINHPNVVRVRTYFTANATAYLVMDYYQGFTLAEHLQHHAGRLPEDEARQLILPILEGLRAVHAEGFLHRDIKPQNIYLARIKDSGDPRPILIDFGAARAAPGERAITVTAIFSHGFSPIEQYDEKGKLGHWTDIYAVAAVLYCVVTGIKHPQQSTLRQIGDRVKPAVDFGVSKPLSDALSKGLAIKAIDRPQTVEAFQAMLAKAFLRKGPSTRYWLWLAGIAPILLLLIGLAVTVYRTRS